MDLQYIFNFGLGAACAVLGWFGRTLYSAIEAIKDELTDHKVLVASQYVSKRDLDEIKAALIRIETAVHNKAER
jgi:hypothetical protein